MGQPGVRQGKAHRRQIMPTGLLAGAQKAKKPGAPISTLLLVLLGRFFRGRFFRFHRLPVFCRLART
jgi:hypothetical protein